MIEETIYGFKWGPALVERLLSDDRAGYVLRVKTDHRELQIRISPKGRVIECEEVLFRGSLDTTSDEGGE